MDLDLNRGRQHGAATPNDVAAVDLRTLRIDSRVALSLPESLAVRRGLLAFGRHEGQVYVACADPSDVRGLEAVERATDCSVVAFRADPKLVEKALRRLFHRREPDADDDAVRTVENLVHGAVTEGASDVHVEPGPRSVRVRYRVDGQLDTVRTLSTEQMAGVVNRIKILAGMDISEHRIPQDGRFGHRLGTDDAAVVDVRAALMPCRFGERITLRLLGRQADDLTLERLGMAEADLESFRGALSGRGGLVLLAGSTGSGKTTTLYAGLRTLDLDRLNAITIEDPVEYDLPAATQIEADGDDREAFGRALRGILRHDPDVVMIGEIRDIETAEVAVRAALTGHLVLSTLHTRSAAGAVARLIDMGVPSYLVDATLRLVVAQRLVRRLCTRCRRSRRLDAAGAALLGDERLEGTEVFEPVGCGFCRQAGYVGRLGLFESFRPAPGDVQIVAEGRLPVTGRTRTSLADDARAKVVAGLTSPSEALRELEVQ